MKESADTFDPEKAIDAYRRAINQRDAATTVEAKTKIESTAKRLRKSWAAWQGEDSLHEIAFGEPEP